MSAVLYNIEKQKDKYLLTKTFKNFYDEGKIIIYPTDTIYGLGGNPFNKDVVDKINSIKRRDVKKVFIYLIGTFELLQTYIDDITDNRKKFLKNIWPNPVSVILNLNADSIKIFGSTTACFRIPDHKFCTNVLNELNRPLISTSVNISNQPPFVDPDKIIQEYGNKVDAIFYSAMTPNSISSTIIDLTGPEIKLIREGTLKFVELLKNLT